MTDTTLHTQTSTGLSDQLDGTGQGDIMAGLAGDDSLSGLAGDDLLYGDYSQDNLLDTPDGAVSFADYSASGDWTLSDLDGGHQQMDQQITTEIGGVYNLTLDLAANFAAGHTGAAVEVLVDGVVVAQFSTSSGAYGTHSVQFTATDTSATLTLRSVDAGGEGPVIDTSGPVFHYDTQVEIGGTPVTVAAFADGQANLYQVLDGTLHVFDVDSQTYDLAGVPGTVNVNSMGYNAENDLLYAIAVGSGVDSLGQAVNSADLVMIDAEGYSYRIGATPYRAWTGDFDDQGNLWSFQSSMDRIAVIDVDQLDEDGNPLTTIHQLPGDLIGFNVYDVAFDAATRSFYGVARPAGEGQDTVLLVIDISGAEPVFETIPVTSTVVDGAVLDGAPYMTFGAAIIDAEGTPYVGGNSGDHDMDNATAKSGGIYQVVIDPDTGEASLHLIEEAPKSSSNDGAADPTAPSPFAPVDLEAGVLVRDLSLVATTEGVLSYDDALSGNAGQDTLSGGIGQDALIGGSAGDLLQGDAGADTLHGGAGPDAGSGIVSVYDEEGLRYDQNGTLLGEDDDALFGGDGQDDLSGSAGHDTLDGGAGDDVLSGGSGFDQLAGGQGHDTLSGGSETDTLEGGDGDDLLEGGSGDDMLAGGAGADVLTGGSGADLLQGQGGQDDLSGGSGNDNLSGGGDADLLDGGSGDDVLAGDAGDDVLTGGSDDDHLSGGDGADTLEGGADRDTLEGGGGQDRLKGGSADDLLQGGDGKDYLNGGSGADTLDGGAGKDRLYLGAGDDVATGGENADRFVFRLDDLDGGTDVITDFSVAGGDMLDLRGLELTGGQLWMDANLQVTETGDLQLTLAPGSLLILEDAASEYDSLLDSILF